MNKKLLLILTLVAIVVAVLFIVNRTLIVNKPKQTNIKANQGVSYSIPDNLLDCSPEFIEKTVDCSTVPDAQYCSYYKSIKDGVEKYHNLQFENECDLCRTQKGKGELFYELNGTSYIHLGYEKGKCYQGMYKQ